MGDVTLELLLKDEGKFKSGTTAGTFYIATPDKSNYTKVAELASQIRSRGARAITDISGKSFNAQIRDAAREGCSHFVVLGEKELKSESVSVKDLATGEQKMLKRSVFFKTLSAG